MCIRDRDNIPQRNYRDYFIYWKQRLQDLPFGEQLILEHLQHMLPMRAQARIQSKDLKSLATFAEFVEKVDHKDLYYYDSKTPNMLAQREQIFQRNQAKKQGFKGSYQKKEIPINTVGVAHENEDKDNSDFQKPHI